MNECLKCQKYMTSSHSAALNWLLENIAIGNFVVVDDLSMFSGNVDMCSSVPTYILYTADQRKM